MEQEGERIGQYEEEEEEVIEEEDVEKKQQRLQRKNAIEESQAVPQILYPGYPEARLLVYNIGKKHNIGTIIRTCVAFGISQICIVGQKKYIMTYGNQLTTQYMAFKYFDTLESCMHYLKDEEGFELVGIEIGQNSININEGEKAFGKKICFVSGNEGDGLNERVLSYCDRLVYIPQYGIGTASLNVATATGIILHRFAEWAQYNQAKIIGQKFVVDESKQRKDPGLKYKEDGANNDNNKNNSHSTSSS